MMEMDEKDRNKFILICVVVLAVVYVGGNWATTQLIADALEYHELLPGRIFGNVFQPFAVDLWRSDAELYDAIQRTIRSYFYVAWIFYGMGIFICCTYRFFTGICIQICFGLDRFYFENLYHCYKYYIFLRFTSFNQGGIQSCKSLCHTYESKV